MVHEPVDHAQRLAAASYCPAQARAHPWPDLLASRAWRAVALSKIPSRPRTRLISSTQRSSTLNSILMALLGTDPADTGAEAWRNTLAGCRLT